MAAPVTKNSPEGRSTVWQKPEFRLHGERDKPEPPAIGEVPQPDPARPGVEGVVRELVRTGWSEAQARHHTSKSPLPSERMAAARARHEADEAAAVEQEAKRWREDPDLKRVPQVFRDAWGRRGMSLEEQRREARHIPESRLLPEEGAK